MSSTPPALPPRRRLAAAERREQILAAAREIFLAEGVEQASMRRIAARVGVTAPVIYQHFADKEALLFAIGEAFFERLIGYVRAAIAGREDPVGRLEALMRAYVRCGLDHPSEYRLTFMTGLSHLHRRDRMDELNRFRERRRQGETPSAEEVTRGMRAFEFLESAVEALVGSGRTRLTDVPALSETIWAAGHGLVALIIIHDDFGWRDPDTLIETSIELILRGLLRAEARAPSA